ncbi:MAG: hypothetical protein SFY69_04135 [Planctomycetota bacterium]|nr:hypothetical protein [Planctomycetota bacterium]
MTDAAGGNPAPIPEDTLVRAMAAFKKRHKLTKLDQESKLGASRPMTSGKKVENLGIIPPNDYPREVYRELARQGKIKDMGGGFYSMP